MPVIVSLTTNFNWIDSFVLLVFPHSLVFGWHAGLPGQSAGEWLILTPKGSHTTFDQAFPVRTHSPRNSPDEWKNNTKMIVTARSSLGDDKMNVILEISFATRKMVKSWSENTSWQEHKRIRYDTTNLNFSTHSNSNNKKTSLSRCSSVIRLVRGGTTSASLIIAFKWNENHLRNYN